MADLWTPPPLWRGQAAFVMASGPSMTREIADRVRGANAIAVNSTIKIAPWAPVWFFTDTASYEANRAALDAYRGTIVTMCKRAKADHPERVARVKGEWMPGFPPAGSQTVRQGRSSGHTAVSLAVSLGASLVVLLGFDMRVVDDREHHHDDYAGTDRDPTIYEREFIPGFRGWREDAARAGVIIVNATPGSALAEFPSVDLDDVL